MSYQPIPVDAARDLADLYGKAMVVILAYDGVYERTHCTTYGRSSEQKVQAANIGESCAALVSDVSQMRIHEDFRFVPEATRAAQVEALSRACRAADHAIASVMAVRDGASDELLQSVRDAITKAFEQAGVKF